MENRNFTSMDEFLDACRSAMRYRRLSYHTEKTYLDWIERFVRHFKRIKPQVTGEKLADPLRKCGYFPPDVVEMIAIAEESNSLEKVLVDVAKDVQDLSGYRVNEARENLRSPVSGTVIYDKYLLEAAISVMLDCFRYLMFFVEAWKQNGHIIFIKAAHFLIIAWRASPNERKR